MNSRVIVSAIIKKGNQFLLGRKSKDVGPYPNSWHLIGGGVNLEEETTEEAIIREIKEETGIEIEGLKKVSFDEDYEPDKKGEMTHYVFLVYKCEYKSGKPKAQDDIEELRWFSKSELKNIPLTRPSIKLLRELGNYLDEKSTCGNSWSW